MSTGPIMVGHIKMYHTISMQYPWSDAVSVFVSFGYG